MKSKTISCLFESVKENKMTFFLVMIAVIATIVISLLPALVLERIVDLLSLNEEVSLILIISYFGLIALNCLAEATREKELCVFGQKVTYGLRKKMCEKLSKMKSIYFSKTSSEELVSRFVNDVDTVENLFSNGIISMFADMGKIISVMVMIFVKNKGLAIILIAVLPFIYLFTRFMQKRMLASQLQNRIAVSKVTGYVPQTVRCIRMIHCFSIEKYMQDNYDEYLDESFKATSKTNFYDSIYSPVILFVNALIVSIVFLLSSTTNETIRNFFMMSAGSSAAVISYITVIFTPLESIGMEIQTVQSAIAGLKRIDDYLNEDEREDVNENVTITENKPVVSLDKVSFAYEKENVLNNLSFDVEKGDNVTLIGRSGAGKSTILKLILGLYSPNNGHVYVNDTCADRIGDRYKRKIFGYVPQSFAFVQGTIKDQITLFDETISDDQVYKALDTVGLTEAISHLPQGVDTICKKELFSQGQWQLLSIARAIVSDPYILLLDEITANLDERTQLQVLAALKKVSADYTVISVSHRFVQDLDTKIIDVSLLQQSDI